MLHWYCKATYNLRQFFFLKRHTIWDGGSTNLADDIPSSIGKLKKLRFLALQVCLFNGTFPDEIGDLANLEKLDLSNNLFKSSTLLLSWTKLSKLKVFYMYVCNLFGEMPESMGEMVSLEDLDISQNGLTGKIPSGLFMLKDLTRLLLSRNDLSGELPDVVEALNLTIIELAQNNLTGKIPDDFRKLQKLTGLSLLVNNFSGEIPQSIGQLPSLIDFKVFMNNLSGTLEFLREFWFLWIFFICINSTIFIENTFVRYSSS